VILSALNVKIETTADNRMEKRSLPRFLNKREGMAHSVEGWRGCTTVDVSRRGLCLRFYAASRIPLDEKIHLEILAFKDLKPICISGILKWIKKVDSHFVGGVELNELLSEHEWIKLRDHFNFV
jgi:hypothetical protein